MKGKKPLGLELEMLRVCVQMKRLRDFLLGTFNQWIQVRVGILNDVFWCVMRTEGLFRLESAVPSSENDVMSVLYTFLRIVMAFCILARRNCIV